VEISEKMDVDGKTKGAGLSFRQDGICCSWFRHEGRFCNFSSQFRFVMRALAFVTFQLRWKIGIKSSHRL